MSARDRFTDRYTVIVVWGKITATYWVAAADATAAAQLAVAHACANNTTTARHRPRAVAVMSVVAENMINRGAISL